MNYCNSRNLIKGTVLYDDMTPVKNAIVILERYFPQKIYKYYYLKYDKKYLLFTKTNSQGEFYFYIYNNNYYYKVKVFNNTFLYKTNEKDTAINI